MFYVRFTKWRSIRSWLIRWLTESEWSDVNIEYYCPIWDGQMVVRAGPYIEPASSYMDRSRGLRGGLSYKVNTGARTPTMSDLTILNSPKRGFFFTIYAFFLLFLWKMGFPGYRAIDYLSEMTGTSQAISLIRSLGIDCDIDPEVSWPGILEGYIRRSSDYTRQRYDTNTYIF